MKKFLSKLMLVIGIFAVICCISNISRAEDANDIIHDITQLDPTSTTVPEPTPEPANNVVTEPINNVGGNNVATTNTTLPKTGVDDTLMFVLIGLCGLAAVYTYKKVRDYNV